IPPPISFFQAEDCIRDLRMSRGLGDVYKRQALYPCNFKRTFFNDTATTEIYTRKIVGSVRCV
ncbi:hypothetical protein, partial [Staphylococcus aureus]